MWQSQATEQSSHFIHRILNEDGDFPRSVSIVSKPCACGGDCYKRPQQLSLGEHSALWLCRALIHAAMLGTVALAAGQQQCESQDR
jgi:hypothetical protein